MWAVTRGARFRRGQQWTRPIYRLPAEQSQGDRHEPHPRHPPAAVLAGPASVVLASLAAAPAAPAGPRPWPPGWNKPPAVSGQPPAGPVHDDGPAAHRDRAAAAAAHHPAVRLLPPEPGRILGQPHRRPDSAAALVPVLLPGAGPRPLPHDLVRRPRLPCGSIAVNPSHATPARLATAQTRAVHQAFGAANGRELSGTGPGCQCTQTVAVPVPGGAPGGLLAGHTLQCVATLLSQGVQIVSAIRSGSVLRAPARASGHAL